MVGPRKNVKKIIKKPHFVKKCGHWFVFGVNI